MNIQSLNDILKIIKTQFKPGRENSKKLLTLLIFTNFFVAIFASFTYLFATFGVEISDGVKNFLHSLMIIVILLTVILSLIIMWGIGGIKQQVSNIVNFTYSKVFLNYLKHTSVLIVPLFLTSLIISYENVISCAHPGSCDAPSVTTDEDDQSGSGSDCNSRNRSCFENNNLLRYIVPILFLFLILIVIFRYFVKKKYFKDYLLWCHTNLTAIVLFCINLFILLGFTNILVDAPNKLCRNLICNNGWNIFISIFYSLILFGVFIYIIILSRPFPTNINAVSEIFLVFSEFIVEKGGEFIRNNFEGTDNFNKSVSFNIPKIQPLPSRGTSSSKEDQSGVV